MVAILCFGFSLPVRATSAPRELETALEQADEHASAGRHDAALRAYSQAFALMPAETKASGVGEFVVLAAGRAAIADYEQRGDRGSLEAARGIIREFIAAVNAAGSRHPSVSVDAAQQQLSEIEKLMPPEESSPTQDVGAAAVEQPEQQGEPELQPDTGGTPAAEESPKLRGMGKAGVALLVVGGLGAIAGVTMVAIEPKEFPAAHPRADQLQTTRPPGYAALGVGGAALIVGAVLLGLDRKQAKQRASKAEALVHPWVGPRGVGVGVVGRF
jgi:hypothetical protein